MREIERSDPPRRRSCRRHPLNGRQRPQRRCQASLPLDVSFYVPIPPAVVLDGPVIDVRATMDQGQQVRCTLSCTAPPSACEWCSLEWAGHCTSAKSSAGKPADAVSSYNDMIVNTHAVVLP